MPASAHALATFHYDHAPLLVEGPIDQEAETADAELAMAPRLIEQLPWSGRVLPGNALYRQRSICHQVLHRTFAPQAR